MAETYTRNLSSIEYLGVFRLGEFFDGNEASRFVATKINERITSAVRSGSTKKPKLDAKGESELDADGNVLYDTVPPESIEITFTRAELDSFFIGIKETLKKSEIKAGDITMIASTCKALGMKLRFEKYAESVLSTIVRNPEPLDNEVVTDPLD